MTIFLRAILLIIFGFLSSQVICQKNDQALFTLLASHKTGIDFINQVEENFPKGYSILSFPYFYNGGGVAVGDINNDGLEDVFFTGNTVSNELYLNKGDLQFEKITQKAGLKSTHWSNGVVMADINGDGWLDIYVSRGGPTMNSINRSNLLYINNQDKTFTERAKKYGVADQNKSTHASFFDYDNDGDLDLFVLNHFLITDAKYITMSMNAIFQELLKKGEFEKTSNRLFRNDGGEKFTDVTATSGILAYCYGLGVNISDINDDGWPDIYVSNDFDVPDFLFINQKNGRFIESIKKYTKQVSYNGMGCDIADFNNDGNYDIAQVDMASTDHYRSKTMMPSMSTKQFEYLVKERNFQYQYMYNSLQLNNGNNTFSNIANQAGIASTDWSWSGLFADFDNDGKKDYWVTNGYRKSMSNNDFGILINKALVRFKGKIPPDTLELLAKSMDEIKLPNLMFQNQGDFSFNNVAKKWGLGDPSFSSGAAYADLDNDGDLDLLINNIDQPAFIYRNNLDEKANYLKVKLLGNKNVSPFNAKVEIQTKLGIQVIEYNPSRGYQSNVTSILHFGLGKIKSIEKLKIRWSNGSIQEIKMPKINQQLVLKVEDAIPTDWRRVNNSGMYKEQLKEGFGIPFTHKENLFDDFDQETLLPHKQSSHGPTVEFVDVNNDGLDDLYVGGAKGQSGAIYTQNKLGEFNKILMNSFAVDANSEDLDACFFDVNNDGFEDLYVCSGGGGEFSVGDSNLQDRLYLNKNGTFHKSTMLPQFYSSSTKAIAADIDGDGDMDMFIGGGSVPGKYPFSEKSRILLNQNGELKEGLNWGNAFKTIGIVRDAVFTDFNDDGKLDLIIVGEWTSIMFFKNNGIEFINVSSKYCPKGLEGWWQSLKVVDLNGDGQKDLIVGNIGANNKYHPTLNKPLEVYANDFDGNGSCDIVLSKKYKGKSVPARGRECSSGQMPFISKKFPTYDGFANASIHDIFGEKLLESLQLKATEFHSIVLFKKGDKYDVEYLPALAQISPIMDIEIIDLDKDNDMDIIIVGNKYNTEVETPRYDAGNGMVLRNNGNGKFSSLSINESGFFTPKNAKSVAVSRSGKFIAVGNNNDKVQFFKLIK